MNLNRRRITRAGPGRAAPQRTTLNSLLYYGPEDTKCECACAKDALFLQPLQLLLQYHKMRPVFFTPQSHSYFLQYFRSGFAPNFRRRRLAA